VTHDHGPNGSATHGMFLLPEGFRDTTPSSDPADSAHEPPDNHFPRTGADLPKLVIRRDDLPTTARELAETLADDPHLYYRGDRVVYVHHDERGDLVITAATKEDVINVTHRYVRPAVERKTEKGVETIYITLPNQVAALYLALRGDCGLRPLAAITSSPVFHPSGEILTGDGYDPVTRTLRHQVPNVHVPDYPTDADARRAFTLLRRAIATFPFADAVCDQDGSVDQSSQPGLDESSAIAALVTACLRASLPLCPAFAVRAAAFSGSGVGKGLLTRTIAAIAFGRPPRTITPGHSAEELDKRIVSAVLAGYTAILFDNCNGHTLKSDTLASLVTECPTTIRPLGSSEAVTVDSRAWIVVTGNALEISEDLARRFLVTNLDARMENPETRRFTFDPVERALQQRPELLGAVGTIWRWGRQRAGALPAGAPLGSFAEWCRQVRDPLLALGIRDPVERIAEIKAADPRRIAVAELFAAWEEHHRDHPVRAADLAEPVRSALDPKGLGRQYLVRRLRELVGTRYAGRVLVAIRSGGRWSAAKYRLEQTE
jgi:hypothetical protein